MHDIHTGRGGHRPSYRGHHPLRDGRTDGNRTPMAPDTPETHPYDPGPTWGITGYLQVAVYRRRAVGKMAG